MLFMCWAHEEERGFYAHWIDSNGDGSRLEMVYIATALRNVSKIWP